MDSKLAQMLDIADTQFREVIIIFKELNKNTFNFL